MNKARGKNWSSGEDEAVCLAWLDVSQDPVTSINQKSDTLYNRIQLKFCEICREKKLIIDPELRAVNGIKSRFSIISKSVSKFAGCLSQVNSRQQSGASPEDVLQQALMLYSTKENSPFTLMHCFKVLESAPKWSQYVAAKKNIATPGKRKSASSQDKATENDDSAGLSRDESPPSASSGTASVRPKGQKQSKLDKSSNKSLTTASLAMADSGRALADVAKQKLKDSIQRTSVFKQMVNHTIMSVDFTNLSNAAKEFYHLEQKRILEEARNAAGGNVEQFEYSGNQGYEDAFMEVPDPQTSTDVEKEDESETVPATHLNDVSDAEDVNELVQTQLEDSDSEHDEHTVTVRIPDELSDSESDES